MLHHVPSPELQDLLLDEVHRVLRPNAMFVGTDATDTPALRDLHVDDVFVPIESTSFKMRLERAGFVDIEIEDEDSRLRFIARKPKDSSGATGTQPRL